jgi:acyl-CoA thioesterase FadM
MSFVHELRVRYVCRDGRLLVECRLRHVFVDRATWAKTPIPDEIRAKLAGPAA